MPFAAILPRPYSARSIREFAPPLSGVYGLSSGQEWVYIGESDNIQEALLCHLHEMEPMIRERGPTGFVYEVCDRSSRSRRLDRLVFEYEPACNRHWSRQG
jgi:hypothetical protein